ncbi:MAG: hypothetical protein GF419_09645 [Ignavibacteriales bacterium]|nr:hypothetical protein [Ignavibacteriales bacterium]
MTRFFGSSSRLAAAVATLLLLFAPEARAQFPPFTSSGLTNDSLDFFTPNWSGSLEVAYLINGVRIGGGVSSEARLANAISEATSMPIWQSGVSTQSTSASVSFVYNPFVVAADVSTTSLNLDDAVKRFAAPPARPDETRSQSAEVVGLSASASYLPVALLWGYLYPSVGAGFQLDVYDYEEKTTTLVSGGPRFALTAKYNFLFIRASYTKYVVNTESFDDRAAVDIGILFTLYR